MNASAALLSIEGLTIDLPEKADRRHAVENLNLSLNRNEILCVVGESGSGKSLMSRAILGLFPSRHVKPSAGKIIFKGEDLLAASAARLRDLRGNRISMIFQEPMTALNPVMKIGAQIEEALATHLQIEGKTRHTRVAEMLAAVNLPDPEKIMQSYPHQLSGGQRQRAMIAMALMLEPDILIADEPTTALDVTTQAQILKLIRQIQKKNGMGVLFVTHDFGVVAEIADRVAVMQSGLIVEQGAAEEVLERPKAQYTRSLLESVPSLIPGPKIDFAAKQVMIAAKGLSKTYKSGGSIFASSGRQVNAVNSVDFEIRHGETLGIVGESGSGKSTLARCITRLVDSDDGSILINGVDIAKLKQDQLRPVRRRMQMVFQDPFGSLNPRRTVGQLISEGPIVHGIPDDQAWQRTYELLELVGLERKAANRYPHEFSGGQRQRIGLARALALQPEILVADEPVSALDVTVQSQVLNLLSDLRGKLGLTMLFITHDLRVASQVCDSIAVMLKGEIVEYGPVADVYANPRHAYTKELLAAVPGRDWSHLRDGASQLN